MTYGIWPGFSGEPESCWNMHGLLFWHRYVYVATGFRCTSKLWLTNDSKPFAASFWKFNSDHLSQDWPTQELAIQLINRLHLLLVINNNNQERQWNPTWAISDQRTHNSNIGTLIRFKNGREMIHLCSTVCHTNDLLTSCIIWADYVGWMSKEAYLDEAFSKI
jgi:hypothetical protein